MHVQLPHISIYRQHTRADAVACIVQAFRVDRSEMAEISGEVIYGCRARVATHVGAEVQPLAHCVRPAACSVRPVRPAAAEHRVPESAKCNLVHLRKVHTRLQAPYSHCYISPIYRAPRVDTSSPGSRAAAVDKDRRHPQGDQSSFSATLELVSCGRKSCLPRRCARSARGPAAH